jgi:hypothetical protein
MDEQQVARMQVVVEEGLRSAGAKVSTLNAGEFRAKLAEYMRRAPRDTSEALLVNLLTMHYIADEAATTPINVGNPPADWRIHSREVMRVYQWEQTEMLAVFGLDKPVHWTQIAPLLEGMCERQDRKGDHVWLDYPAFANMPVGDGRDRVIRSIPVWPGYTRDEFNKALWSAPTVEEDNPDSDLDLTGLLPDQPLDRLARTSKRIAESTGILQSEAVAFLLAGEDVVLPWIRVEVAYRGFAGATQVTLTIGTTEVRPDEVRAEYERARLADPLPDYRDAFDSDTADWLRGLFRSDIPVPTYVRRPIPEKTAAMLAFVDRYKTDEGLQRMTAEDWDACNDAFDIEYAGTYEKYGSGETLRTAYSRAKRRASGRRRVSHG